MIGPVALQAQIVAFLVELQAMGIMTVAAMYVFHKHPALQERAIDIVLFEDLAVGKVQWGHRCLRQEVIQVFHRAMVKVRQG